MHRERLRTEDWGRVDVVMLFNILHNLTEKEAKRALEKARAAASTLLILDGERAATDGNLNAAEAFGELFFFALSASKTWPGAVPRPGVLSIKPTSCSCAERRRSFDRRRSVDRLVVALHLRSAGAGSDFESFTVCKWNVHLVAGHVLGSLP